MNNSDKKYYERLERHNEKHQKALEKARVRGEVAEEWLKTHTLNKDTEAEFRALMKPISHE